MSWWVAERCAHRDESVIQDKSVILTVSPIVSSFPLQKIKKIQFQFWAKTSKVEKQGIDPRTSSMLSERSAI